MLAVLLILSLVVSMDVFWWLRQPGLTLAGDADCGIVEHSHDEGCQGQEVPCALAEHIHDISCYSDDTADTETQLDWQKMFADYPYGKTLRENLVGIAKTQVGYRESTLNFRIGEDGLRRGYTRYGAWYGVPYIDWSAVFVAFCLHYAKADGEDFPANTGAASMAELWKKLDRYAPAGEYSPVAGDLVFFSDNTVGIVTELQTAAFYVIRGDREGAVTGEMLSLTEPSIAGWGVTEEPEKDVPVAEGRDPTKEEMLDISNGPAVFIFQGGSLQTVPFALRGASGVVQIVPYLQANGGSYFFTLLDQNNQELPKDANGNYMVHAGTPYKLTVSFVSPNGFVPGSYQYRFPDGLVIHGGEGTFVLKDGTHVGDWVVSDDGAITLHFNEHMNSRTDITVSATMGVEFPQHNENIDFDGKISVTIEKPPEVKDPTKLNKWGSQGVEGNWNKNDPTKIYWTAYVEGHTDSQIPGSILTDKVVSGEWLGDHRYTESDMAAGLSFGVSEPDPVTGQAGNWHSWVVYPGDPNLTWTETGWAYKIPETATCQWCGQVTLGNNGWTYTIDYSSTPLPSNVAGAMGYMNQVAVDWQYADGWAEFTQGEVHADLVKNGTFIADAGGGSFRWELQVMIPGMQEGKKADYFWFLMDYMDVRDETLSLVDYITNDAANSRVTATHNGGVVVVPRIQDATANDPYAWHNYWSVDHGDGVYYGRQINLLCRCHCTEASCPFWNNGRCGSEYWYEADDGYWYTNGYCQCWTATENTTFTFSYTTKDMAVIEEYGGQGHQLRNEAVLYHKPNGTDGVVVASKQAYVPIPGLFKKVLTHDFNGYTANYQITVNEGKLNLTDGSPVTIHDEMTPTLVYISGSLVITAEDVYGNITTLEQDKDYTVTYDGTGGARDAQGNPVHVLDIVLLHPQPVTYLLDYDATLVIPSGATEAVKYSNSAHVTLWGEKISSDSVEKVYADINIAAKHYKVEMFKTCATTGKPLQGATFGLYNAHDGLIASDITDSKGNLAFQSNVTEGIILREHQLYYMRELKAPAGYRLDDTKYWFFFCDRDTVCQECANLMARADATRVPHGEVGKVHAVNEIMHYDLPATGGSGTYPLILASVTFIVIPLVYGFIQRRKRERRGVD